MTFVIIIIDQIAILESMEYMTNLSANDYLTKKANLLDALHIIVISWNQVSEI